MAHTEPRVVAVFVNRTPTSTRRPSCSRSPSHRPGGTTRSVTGESPTRGTAGTVARTTDTATTTATTSTEWLLFVEESTAEGELWHGPRTGVREAVGVLGCDRAYPLGRLGEVLAGLYGELKMGMGEGGGGGGEVSQEGGLYLPNDVPCYYHRGGGGKGDSVDVEVRKWRDSPLGPGTLMCPAHLFWELRMVKSQAAQRMMTHAAEITKDGFRAAMGCTAPGLSEHHVASVLEFACQLRGAEGLAYVPVVASGRNALSLHYIDNNAMMQEGDLVMVDAGASYHYYPTDCTRVWPVGERFSPAQRKLYNALLEVQKGLIREVVPGRKISTMHGESERRVLEALQSVGVIDPQWSPAQKTALLRRIYPHNWGHPMGIDIHENYSIQTDCFVPGMMHTVEPGVYIPDDSVFPPEFRGIGFRIEDNLIVGGSETSSTNTPSPPIVITAGIPKEVDEIEDCKRRFAETDPLYQVVKRRHSV